ncbi:MULTISPECIES: hypothetical protein [unclassified Rhodococcus (in: high G+C Gram-positive bacteria)]|nr:hypothetical protein [Rhodococcus sp. 3A]MBC2897090.1 hypothetical protein [Rhodococcus sp. 4CII]
MAFVAGLVRDEFDGYDAGFFVAGGLGELAVVMSLAMVSKTERLRTLAT